MTNLEQWQIEASRVYGGGDYFGFDTLEQTENVGDSIYTALQRELSPLEDCSDAGEARRRVQAIITDLELVLNAI